MYRAALYTLLICTSTICGQYTTNCAQLDNKKIIKLYEKAQTVLAYNEKEGIRMIKDDVLSKCDDFADAHYLLGVYYFDALKDPTKILRQDLRERVLKSAETHLRRSNEICPSFGGGKSAFLLGNLLHQQGDLKGAMDYFENCMGEDGQLTPAEKQMARKLYHRAQIRLEIKNSPVQYDPVAVNGINTASDEYLPALSPDNEFLFFTRKVEGKRNKDDTFDQPYHEAFLRSRRNGATIDSFSNGFPLPKPFNDDKGRIKGKPIVGMGGMTITPDNKHLFVTIAYGETARKADTDIFYSHFEDNAWTPFKSLGNHINSFDSWEAQPTVSADGRTLVFASARESSMDQSIDLYIITKNEHGGWSAPKNLGPRINTPGNEKTPFLHPDGKTLYFSSTGHPGIGGYDIFFSKRLPDGSWSQAKNLGYPINTEKDEHGFVVSLDGKHGFLGTGRAGDDKGGLQIITFPMPENTQPEKVVYIKGQLKDRKGIDVENGSVQIKNMQTGESYEAMVDRKSGEYVAIISVSENPYGLSDSLNLGKSKKEDLVQSDASEAFHENYAPRQNLLITAKKEGSAFSSSMVSVEPEKIEGAIKHKGVNIDVDPIKVGDKYRINNIKFATNSFILTPRSKFILDSFIDFLKTNPSVKIAIHGHTDSEGNNQDNLVLSNNRAKSVHDYLISNGIQSDRLTYKGFGENQPIASNESEKGRAKNRRTEFVVLAK